MLNVQQKREVLVGGFQDQTQFTIQSNAKMFDILIDKLYSDKVEAVLREYMSNAFDSHVQAGCADRPFIVHLPTQWEPWLSIRDFGVSMTHEMIMSKASSIGWSSKDGTYQAANTDGVDDSQAIVPEIETQAKQVGKLGLGMKSGYAYSDSFSITAYLNGEKRMYNCYRDENRTPVMAHALTEPTDEERGLEINIPVQVGDINHFKFSMEKLSLGFDVQPIITGTKISNLPSPSMAGENYRVFNGIYSRHGVYARQGVVIYPVSKESLSDLPSHTAALWNDTIIIDFEVGMIDVTPSRESLSYDSITVDNIKKRLIEVYQDIVADYRRRFNSIKSRFSARVWRNEVLDKASYNSVCRAAFENAKHRGRHIQDSVYLPDAWRAATYETGRRQKVSLKLRAASEYYNGLRLTNNNIIVMHFEDQGVRHLHARLEHLIREISSGAVGQAKSIVFIKAPSQDRSFYRFLSNLGRYPWINIADVDVTPTARQRNITMKAPAFMSSGRLSDSDSRNVFDPKGGGYFVYTDRSDFLIDELGTSRSLGGLADTIRRMQTAGALEEGAIVYCFNTQRRKIPLRNEGWVNLVDKVREFCRQEHSLDVLDSVHEYARFVASKFWTVLTDVKGFFGEDHLLNQAAKLESAYKQANEDAEVARAISDLRETFGVSTEQDIRAPVPNIMNEATTYLKKLEARYPLVETIYEAYRYSRMSSTTKARIADYVRAMDLLHSREAQETAIAA